MRNKPQCIVILLLLGSIFFSSCKKGIPSEVIQPSQMEDILYDYHLAQAMGNDFNGEERYKRELLMQYVFEKHGVTKEQFDSSLVWYTRNTEELSKIYDNVSERFTNMNRALIEMIGTSVVQAKAEILVGDSVNIWRNDVLYRLSNMDMTNKLIFVIPTDTSYRPRDQFVWEVNALFLNCKKVTERNAEMEMNIHYKNDSVATVHQSVVKGVNRLSIQADTLAMKEIRGFIYFRGDSINEKALSLLVHDISLMRYHVHEEVLELDADISDMVAEDSLQNVDVKATDLETDTKRLTPQQLREQRHSDQKQVQKAKTTPKTNKKPISNTARKQPNQTVRQ